MSDAVLAPRSTESGAQLPDRTRLLHDDPVRLPTPCGPISRAIVRLLDREPGSPADDPDLIWSGEIVDVVDDTDFQLALWLVYELHYRGLAGVDDEWEHDPGLARVRKSWEDQLIVALRLVIAARSTPVSCPAEPSAVPDALQRLADQEAVPSLSQWLMKRADRDQFAEFVIHRSVYHLKEADPHSWAIPRLSGAVKAAMITIQLDEYGLGTAAAMHAQLFRRLMLDWQLDDGYGHYLDRVPGVTLLTTNVISLFGLHRRWRGALVGHLALFEMTSTTPNARYARGHRRLGGSEQAARFFDEHVVADAVHEQIASHDLALGLARTEPERVPDIMFGAQCAALADQLFSEQLIQAWSGHASSLRRPEGMTG